MFVHRSNDGRHIDAVLARTECTKHRVPIGVPCYLIQKSDGSEFRGVCNKRIGMAGFVGTISPAALSRSEPMGRNDETRRKKSFK